MRVGGFRSLLWLLALAGVAACNRSPVTVPASANAPVAAAPFAIQEIRIGVGVDAGPHARLTPLTTHDRVTAELITTGDPGGIELSVRLLSLVTGKDVGKITMPLDRKAVAAPVVLRFPAGANDVPGRYLLELRLGGKLAAKRYLDVAPVMASSEVQAPTSR